MYKPSMAVLTPNKFTQLEREATKLNPSDFCEYWIPRLYKVEPGEYLYRKACIEEFARLLPGVVDKITINKTWRWGTDNDNYPKYLPSVLHLANQMYRIKEALDLLPRHTIGID